MAIYQVGLNTVVDRRYTFFSPPLEQKDAVALFDDAKRLGYGADLYSCHKDGQLKKVSPSELEKVLEEQRQGTNH